jgi:hypothetical protein
MGYSGLGFRDGFSACSEPPRSGGGRVVRAAARHVRAAEPGVVEPEQCVPACARSAQEIGIVQCVIVRDAMTVGQIVRMCHCR